MWKPDDRDGVWMLIHGTAGDVFMGASTAPLVFETHIEALAWAEAFNSAVGPVIGNLIPRRFGYLRNVPDQSL